MIKRMVSVALLVTGLATIGAVWAFAARDRPIVEDGPTGAALTDKKPGHQPGNRNFDKCRSGARSVRKIRRASLPLEWAVLTAGRIHLRPDFGECGTGQL